MIQTSIHKHEWLVCAESPAYFIDRYCQLYDATTREWAAFRLWPAQVRAVRLMHKHRLVVLLKARQIGLSWIAIGYALWLMLFHPAATVSLFSRREEEAAYLLGPERLRGMYERLPPWMHVREVTRESGTLWSLSNGSIARAFPTTAGDSYTVSLAIVDEADLAPDLGKLMSAAKPTIDGGGKMFLVSRADKSHPMSEFKTIYRASKEPGSPWTGLFLPWSARPDRDIAWYEEQKRDSMDRTGALDALAESYPTTDTEALAPKSLDKRIPAAWLEQCYVEQAAGMNVLNIPGLVIYTYVQATSEYVAGADPAEGNPTSDDSAATWTNADTGEEIAKLKGKFQPAVFAAHIDTISTYFNNAGVLVERNNHGHAVLLWLSDNSSIPILDGHDGRPGWYNNSKGKALLYSAAADGFREQETVLHSFDTFTQLASIEGATLLAPTGQMDDLADSYALSLVARAARYVGTWDSSPLEGYRG